MLGGFDYLIDAKSVIDSIACKCARVINSYGTSVRRKGKNLCVYSNCPTTFDTECSSWVENGIEHAYTYAYMFMFGNPDGTHISIITRKLCYVDQLLNAVSERAELFIDCVKEPSIMEKSIKPLSDIIEQNNELLTSEKKSLEKRIRKIKAQHNKSKILIIYAHNLGYDIESIRTIIHYTYNPSYIEDGMTHHKMTNEGIEEIKECAQLHADAHNPIFVMDGRGYEFRDSLIYCGGMSLDSFTKTNPPQYRKAVGDLDYKLLRHSETPLTEKEYFYCFQDVNALAYRIHEEIREHEGKIAQLELTNTGKVRHYVRNKCKGKKGSASGLRYRNLMQRLTLSPEQYGICESAFDGGYTHANASYVGKICTDIQGADFTSSYPSVMALEEFPMSAPDHVNSISLSEYNEIVKDRLIIAKFTFYDIDKKPKVADCYLSGAHEKADYTDGVIDNGRISSATMYSRYMTNIDFDIVRKAYDYADVEITDVLIFEKARLPKEIIESVLTLYSDKTTLKGVDGKEKEYAVKKGMLNSLYGMCVTRILRPKVKLSSNGWETIPLSTDEMKNNIDKNNNSKTRFLFYPWGVFITAYARRNLWSGILYDARRDDNEESYYRYCDTDSIYHTLCDRWTEYVELYHKELQCKKEWLLSDCPWFDASMLNPCDIKGVHHPLGVWDADTDVSTMFKTLGAKRYIQLKKGCLYSTVAGCGKKEMSRKLMSMGNIKDAFDGFCDGLTLSEIESGKLRRSYLNESIDNHVIDYMGNASYCRQKYGVFLSPTSFTLTMSECYLDYLLQFRECVKNE